MSYMSEWIYSEEELREVAKEDREFIREKSDNPLRMASSK